jgi:hypothetical protein
MERFVIQENIAHCPAMLKMTTAPAERRQIEKLLLEKEAKIKKYDDDHKKR